MDKAPGTIKRNGRETFSKACDDVENLLGDSRVRA